ncbi:TetR/AcrR family transcriptional regulator [Actinacidiphila rubida]|uniref:Transcriptional regulator, TetR family n=1 Tax=Actinacidiphila rubida TaxID=310780 RepID=A0A1H8TLK9_9ACTN|nr:TetR/AcrR family transcriptional regulator [Actinacidiphila rubida]SEO91473.1 transcriptional regulator, TetR family [Actinacidiphila rubida]
MTAGEKDGTERPQRRLRADAQRNEDLLLKAAAAAFAKEGAGASVKDIARAAGVGVGTLYRRFPSKELLIEATYRHEVEQLCQAAPELAAARPPTEALRGWMERFLAFMAAKQGMADALRLVLTDEGERLETRAHLTDAVALLLDRGRDQGLVQPHAEPHAVLMMLGGISLMAESERQPDLAGRLVDLLLHGVVKD